MFTIFILFDWARPDSVVRFNGNSQSFNLSVTECLAPETDRIKLMLRHHACTRQWADCFDRIEFNLVHWRPAHTRNSLNQQTRNDKINNHSSYCGHAFFFCLVLVFSLDVAALPHVCNWSVNKRHKNRENHTQYWFLCVQLVGCTQWTERWLPPALVRRSPAQNNILQFFAGKRTIAVSNMERRMEQKHIGYILLVAATALIPKTQQSIVVFACFFFLFVLQRMPQTLSLPYSLSV